MSTKSAALQLGLQLVQHKLGQAFGDPSFSVYNSEPNQVNNADTPAELPVTEKQLKDRSAKVQPPRIVNPR